MAFGQTLGSKGMFSLLIFTNSQQDIHLSFSYHFQPLHLSLGAIAAAALPSFVLPNCLVYWTFLASFGFFGLVSTPMSQKIHSPLCLQVTGSLVGCTSPVLVSLLGLPALSPAFGLVSHSHLLLLKTAIAVQLMLIFTINLISGDCFPWSGGIVRSPKRRSRLGNTFCPKSFFLLFRIRDACILIPISRNVSRPF